MASTNKTAHYDLSQYIGTDKPTYLVDYNTDMSNIDTGIYEADSLAKNNEQNIGNLSNLTTTNKATLVGAINEVKGDVDTNTGDISNLKTRMNTAETNIGDLTNLDTTAKSNLVVAVNEVESETNTNTSNIGLLSNLNTTNKSDLVSAINEIFQEKRTTLYNNPTGTTGSVSLSDDVDNYDYLEVTYTNSGGSITNTIKWDVNIASQTDLFLINVGSTGMFIQAETITFSGNQITLTGNGKGTTINGVNVPGFYDITMKITKVIGIKEI